MSRNLKLAIVAVALLAAVLLAARPAFRYLTAAPKLNQSVDSAKPRVELSFDFARQGGMASNQLAAWVVDKNGGLVKTLFATDYTAGRGGWKHRKEALPQWVEEARVASMNKTQLDALACATPASGRVRLAWYCDDAAGQAVPAGVYTVKLEGSLRWANRVLFQAEVALFDGVGVVEKPAPVFYGSVGGESGMVSNVTVEVKK